MKFRTIGATVALLLLARGEAFASDSSENLPAARSIAALGTARLVYEPAAPIVPSTPVLGTTVPVAAAEFTTARQPQTVETVTYRSRAPWRRVTPRSDAVIYQPRYRASSSSSVTRTTPTAHLQLHGGFMERTGHGATSFASGLRFGPSVGAVQLGIGADWYHESESERDVVGQSFQGGRPVTTTHVLSRTSADLVPVQAHLQLNLGGRSAGLFPYVGAAGGYQLLFLTAQDFETGETYEASFGGWGWQAFGGLGLRLASHAHLFGEAFMNTGNVERDVTDPASGATYREVTDTDGTGLRFGLNWGI